MSAAVRQRPAVDEQIGRLRALVDEERMRARSYAMQSDTESAKEAEARAGELRRRISELERGS